MILTSFSEQDLAERLGFAIDLARRAGAKALSYQHEARQGRMAATLKGRQDFVTEADGQVERMIRSALAERFGEDGFLGEESGGTGTKGPIWVVDPIDGTNNYMRGLSNWGVSIALVDGDEILIGIIYDANFNQVFHARLGGGAFIEDKPLTASRLGDPEQALAFLGYSRRTAFGDYISLLQKLTEAGVDYRRPGAAALGLLRVADGKADLYFEAHLNSWDAMAGLLIAREAGATVHAPSVPVMLARGGYVLAIAETLDLALTPIFETTEPLKAADI